jgi:aryl-alcohol dehydrogenase-like predicted oxidoreductase
MTGLPTRLLGSTGLNITTLGLGSWALGGSGWFFSLGSQDDSDSLATIRRALELGINWIDTAAVYGLGHSEEIVGRLVRELPQAERPFLFTKCGLVWDENNRTTEPNRVLKPDSIRRECEASLRRLGVERIDLYQLHWPDQTGTAVEDSWEMMARLVEEGKIRAAGVSNFNVELLDRCEAVRHVESLQPPFSLIHRSAAQNEIPWCANHRTGVICYSPLVSGLLTESFTGLSKLAETDWRRKASDFQEPNLSRNLDLRDSLRAIARRHSTSVSSVAIAWVLAWPGVTGAIAGARKPAQVDGWIQAASLQLSDEDSKEIGAAIRATKAGEGPFQMAQTAPLAKAGYPEKGGDSV